MGVNQRILNRLEKERKRRGVCRSGFAMYLGMAPQTYSNLMNLQSHITAERLWEVAEILGIPIMEFYEGDE